MPPKPEPQPEKILTIRFFGREKAVKIAAWKYWEIIDELHSRGVPREEAYAAAKWASDVRGKGKYTEIKNMILTVE